MSRYGKRHGFDWTLELAMARTEHKIKWDDLPESKEKKMAKAKKEEKAAKNDMLGTKEVASKLGISPAHLRRVLRASNDKREAGSYSRYEWKKDDSLDKLKALVEKHKTSQKAAKKEAKGKGKAKGKATTKAKGTKKAKPADDDAISEAA